MLQHYRQHYMLLIKLALKINKFALNIDKLAPITLH